MAINIGTLMVAVRGDVAALHADVQSMNVIVRRGFDQMSADMRRAEQAGRQFNEQMRNASMSLRGLVAEAAGLAGIGSAMATVFAVPKAGVKYAADMETMRLGMAGTLASMGQIDGKAIDIGKAVEISAVITGKLQQKAMETSANMHELVGAYQAIIGPGLQAGASLEKMIDFVTAGTVAVKSMGLKSGQVVQELRDLVQGGIQPASSTLATAIGVGDKDIKEIKAKGGDLIGFLMDRMKGFAEASTLYAQTFTGKVSGMQEAFNILASKGSAPIFDALKAGIDGVMNTMGTTKEIIVKNGDEVKKSMTWTVDPEVVAQIRDVSQNVVDLSKSAISVGQALWEWREPIGYIAAAMVTIKGMRFAGAVGDGVGQKFQELRSYFAAEKDAAKAVVGAASGEVERAKAIQLRRAAAQELASKASLKDALAATEVAAANKAAAQSEVPRQSALVRSLELQRTIASANFDVAKGTAAEAMAQKELAAAQRRYSSANEELITGKTKLRELTQAETAAQTRLAAVRDAALGATNANAAATSRLSLATNGLVAAKEREAAAQSIAAMAGRAASGVLAALGGPIGVATLAIFGMVMAWDHLADSTVHAANAAENSANRIRAALKSSNFAAAESERVRLDALYAQQTAESNKVNGLLENMRKRGEDKTMPGLYAQYLGSRDQWANILSDTRAGLAKVTTEINEAKQAQASAALKNVEKAFDPRDYIVGNTKKYQQVDLSSVKPRLDNNYESYIKGDGLKLSKKEQRAKDLEEENSRFKLAVANYKEGSKEYLAAAETHKNRIAEINNESKSGRGGSALPASAKLIAAEAAKLQQAQQELETLISEGQKKAPLMDGEKAALRYGELAKQAKEYGKIQEQLFYEDEARKASERSIVERQINDQRRLNQLRLEFEAADAQRINTQRIANEEAANEVKWLSLSNEERAAQQAAWEVEKKARHDILDLQKQQREATTDELKAQLAARIESVRSQAEEDKIAASSRARRQSSLQEWNQISSDIERALTDSIMRGFEGGKSGIESFKDAIKNSFKTFMVKLLVQPVMSEVNSLGAQLISGQSGQGKNSSSGGDLMGSLNNFGSTAKDYGGEVLSWVGDKTGSSAISGFGASIKNAAGGVNVASPDFVGPVQPFADAGGSGSFLSGSSGSAGNLSTAASYAMAAYNVYNSFKTGKGWGATIGSMASFIPGLGPIAGVVGSMVGGLIDDAFSGGGAPKSGGNANAVFDAAGNVTARDMFGGYTPAEMDASFSDTLKTLQGNYASLTKALGGTAKELTLNLGGDQDPQGSAGNRVSAQVALGSVGVGMDSGAAERALWDKSLYSSVSKSVGGDFGAAVKLETTRMLVAALKASDLPEEVSKFLGEIDLPNATQDQLDTLVAKAQALASLGKVFEQFASVLPSLAGGSLTAKERLVSLSGGLDALASGLSSYRDAYFSDEEKQTATREQISKTLAEVGLSLPATQVEFRKLLESLDPMTESGAKATTTMLAVAGAFAQVSLSATQVQTLNAAFDGLGSLWAGLSGSSQAARLEMMGVAGGLDAMTGRLSAYQKGFFSQEEQRQLSLTALRGEFAALGQVMPVSVGEFRRLVQGIDTSTTSGRTLATQLLGLSERLASVVPSIAEMDKLNGAFLALGGVFPGVAGSSERARLAIANFGGGIDALASSMEGYRSNFYSQVERDQATYRQIAGELAAVGLAMPNSRDAFRKLVEGLDRSSERGEAAFAVLMKVQDAFASIAPNADAAASSVSSVSTSLYDLAKGLQDEFAAAADKARNTLEKLKQATEGRLDVEQWLAKSQGKGAEWIAGRQADLWKMYGAAVSPEQQLELLQELKGLTYEKYQAEIDAVKELTNNAGKLRDAARSIREYVQSLKVGDLSPATMGERLAESASQFYVTLAQAKAGDQTALSAITGKASAYLDLGKQYYGSNAGYSGSTGIFTQVAGALDGLGVSLDGMASGEDLAAAQAQAQLRYSAQAIAEMQKLRDGFSSVENVLQTQLLRQTADAAAILGRMRDDDILTALRGLPAELADLIKGAWMATGSPSAGPGTGLTGGGTSTTTVATGGASTGGGVIPTSTIVPTSTITRYEAPIDPNPPPDPTRQAVESWYQNILGRASDAGGADYWVGQYKSNGETAAYSAFLQASVPERDVRDAYRAALGRSPDDAGLNYWLGKLQGGMSYDEFWGALTSSAEAVSRIPQFAVGTNELPADMLALVHAGERIMPAADNAELMDKLEQPNSLAGVMSAAVDRLEVLAGKLDLLVQTMQQHGSLTAAVTQAGAEAVVGELQSQVQELRWAARNVPSMA